MKLRKLTIALPLAAVFVVAAALSASASPIVPTDPFNKAPFALAPQNMVVDSLGNIFSVDGGNIITETTPDGVSSTYVAANPMITFDVLAIDSSNNLYVYNTNNYEFVELYANGAGIAVLGAPFNADFTVTAMAVDNAGNLFFSATELGVPSLGRIAPLATTVDSVTLSGGCVSPTGLAIDSADNVYIACKDSWSVNKYTPGTAGAFGTEAKLFDTGNSSSLTSYLAVDSSQQNLYVSDIALSEVWKVPTNGDPASVIAQLPGSVPTQIVVDKAGNAYTVGYLDGKIAQISTAGIVDPNFGSLGATDNPHVLAISATGKLYAARGKDLTNALVQFDLAAKLLPAAAGSIPDGIVGVPYAGYTVGVTGVGSFSFAFDAPAPAGLSIDATTGLISGTPQAAGPLTFTVIVTDAFGSSSQSYTINIADAGLLARTGTDAGSSWVTGGGVALAFIGSGTLGLLIIRRNRKHTATATK